MYTYDVHRASTNRMTITGVMADVYTGRVYDNQNSWPSSNDIFILLVLPCVGHQFEVNVACLVTG